MPDLFLRHCRNRIAACAAIFFESKRLVTTRSKRWNGDVSSLPAEYLNGVMAKMNDYGDRVQFSLIGPGSPPVYQVMNTLGKTMAFDKNHHLLQPQEDAFVGANASPVFTLDQLKAGVASSRVGSRSKSTTTRAAGGTGTGRTTAAKLEEQFATQRYEYYKSNRQTLPAGISQHTDEITELMKSGRSVEDAFGEVVKKYF
jgi:hypothetical protein